LGHVLDKCGDMIQHDFFNFESVFAKLFSRANSIRATPLLRDSSIEGGQALGTVEDGVVVVVGRRLAGGGRGWDVSLDRLDRRGKPFAGSSVGHEERVLDDDASLGASQAWKRKIH